MKSILFLKFERFWAIGNVFCWLKVMLDGFMGIWKHAWCFWRVWFYMEGRLASCSSNQSTGCLLEFHFWAARDKPFDWWLFGMPISFGRDMLASRLVGCKFAKTWKVWLFFLLFPWWISRNYFPKYLESFFVRASSKKLGRDCSLEYRWVGNPTLKVFYKLSTTSWVACLYELNDYYMPWIITMRKVNIQLMGLMMVICVLDMGMSLVNSWI